MVNVKEQFSNKPSKFITIILGITFLCYYCFFLLPTTLFKSPYSKVLEDKDGYLLSASISSDGQWRFPTIDSIPDKFIQSLLTFEDKRYYSHIGVDLLSLVRAIKQNVSQQRVVSGASTLTMQVIRLSTPKNPRSVKNKLIEMLKATRLELRHSKEEILRLYVSHAPFGGNVVGLEAACWRYYAKPPAMLSWSEAATLAVLPNAPGLIHPGRNRGDLMSKRNRLLGRLLEAGKMDSLTYSLSIHEPIPDAPKALPRLADHLLHTAYDISFKNLSHGKIKTSIDIFLQKEVNRILAAAAKSSGAEYIHNNAAVIIHVPSGKVRAYVGNAPEAGYDNQEDVDIIMAPRSTGSILKPLLYALCLQDGKYLPNALVQDVPIQLNGYTPKNFSRTYRGMSPFSSALSKSLNVPFVKALQDYKLEKFYDFLQLSQFSDINAGANHYGLSLILGGAEASLWDLSSTYAGMARILNNYSINNGSYQSSDFNQASWLATHKIPSMQRQQYPTHLGAGAIWNTFKAMQELKRPDIEGDWEIFDSAINIAWKTGTSFGFRDAWAIGINPEYVVGVWVGNADGEGRPNLIGVRKAAPILFDLFKALPQGEWFDPPYDDMVKIATCKKSGYRMNTISCPVADTIWAPKQGLKSKICDLHHLAFVNKDESKRVNASCYPSENMHQKSYFSLSPMEAYYYKRIDPDYRPLPPYAEGCNDRSDLESPLEFIYPSGNYQIYIPLELDGKLGETIFKVAHRESSTTIYWHLNNKYVGSTHTFHELALQPPSGKNIITVIDTKGNTAYKRFEILND